MRGSLQDRWSSHFRRTLMNIARGHRHSHTSGNKYGLLRLGLSQLLHCGYYILSLDKEPGYALLDPFVLARVESLALSPKYYRPFYMSQLNFRSLVSQYSSLAQKIGHICDDPRVATNIRSSVKTGYVATPLAVTIKSHKSPGEQSLRTIHRGIQPCFLGLSRWVAAVLSPIIESVRWCAKDSFRAHSLIKNCATAQNGRLVSIDLKDFYLSGEPPQIAQHVSSLVPSHCKDIFCQALFFFLFA